MRTAIYVYAKTTVTIDAEEDALSLVAMKDHKAVALGRTNQLPLEAGVYKIVSGQPVTVTLSSSTGEVQTNTSNKDQWPDPPPGALALNADLAAFKNQLVTFFVVQDARGATAAGGRGL